MNQRIKQLEKQCWSHRVNGTLIDGHLHFDVEKFAELIVRECAAIADIERSNNVGCGYITKTKGMLIKEYFGVEE